MRRAHTFSFAAVATVLSAFLCASAHSDTARWRKPILVELFTSQGCSSCPAADAFVAALPSLGFDRDRVVPLTFHVDYWDNLGWRDPFASARFTERQRRYAELGRLAAPNGSRAPAGVYTPQMIVQGAVHFSGAQTALAIEQMRQAAALAPSFTLEGKASVVDGRAVLSVQVRNSKGLVQGAPDDWYVWAVLAQRQARTVVREGENAGSTLVESAVARVMSGEFPVAAAPMTITLAKPADLAWRNVELVVSMQSRSTGIVAATMSVTVAPHGT